MNQENYSPKKAAHYEKQFQKYNHLPPNKQKNMNKLNTSKLSLTVHSIETSKFNKKKRKRKEYIKYLLKDEV